VIHENGRIEADRCSGAIHRRMALAEKNVKHSAVSITCLEL